ncbi:hypothetical protein BKA70DRAFT_1271940 [Coprinopsis sp. MPI-PUGE-AT-0042]|nr:hypothetical protein BKA70DRAFT_1271940 [Coprinopsis sp. MPI-PUGE-AT-0042]
MACQYLRARLRCQIVELLPFVVTVAVPASKAQPRGIYRTAGQGAEGLPYTSKESEIPAHSRLGWQVLPQQVELSSTRTLDREMSNHEKSDRVSERGIGGDG